MLQKNRMILKPKPRVCTAYRCWFAVNNLCFFGITYSFREQIDRLTKYMGHMPSMDEHQALEVQVRKCLVW